MGRHHLLSSNIFFHPMTHSVIINFHLLIQDIQICMAIQLNFQIVTKQNIVKMQHCFVLSSFARMEVPIFVQVMRIVIITSYPTPHRYMQIHILTYHVLSVDPGSICKINNNKSILEMVMTALFNYTTWFPSSVGCIRQC